MDYVLEMCLVISLWLVLMVPQASAAWSAFASVNRDNESEYDIRVDVSSDEYQRYHYHITVPMVGEQKQCWLILTKSSLTAAQQEFRDYIWASPSGRTDILLVTPLTPSPSHDVQFTIHQEFLAQSYVYIDFPQLVFDGGYYLIYPAMLTNLMNRSISREQTPSSEETKAR